MTEREIMKLKMAVAESCPHCSAVIRALEEAYEALRLRNDVTAGREGEPIMRRGPKNKGITRFARNFIANSTGPFMSRDVFKAALAAGFTDERGLSRTVAATMSMLAREGIVVAAKRIPNERPGANPAIVWVKVEREKEGEYAKVVSR